MHYDSEEFRQKLAARIKALREATGWTQMRMTTDFGYHVSFWQSIEAGRKMSLQTLLRVANTFDMAAEELTQGMKAWFWLQGLLPAGTKCRRGLEARVPPRNT